MLTIVGNLIAGLPYFFPLFLVTPILVLFSVLWGTSYFNRVMGIRYQGRSRTLVSCFYFIGQGVICLALWCGTCLAFAH